MKHAFCFFAAFIGTGAMFAQDQLFKRDNSKTEVKVLEVTPTEIKYKLFTYQDGPLITVPKSEVALIIYQNGAHETFNSPPAAPAQVPLDVAYRNSVAQRRSEQRHYADSVRLAAYHDATINKNVAFLNLMEPLNGSFGLSYLREFADGLFHLHVPVSVGFSPPFFNQPTNTIFGSASFNGVSNVEYSLKSFEGGLGFHLHTSGKRVVTHFIGPYIGFSQFNGRYDSYVYDPMGYTPSYTSRNFVMNRYTFMLDNGLLFRIHKNFNMLLLAGVGYHADDFLVNNPKNYNNTNYYYNYYGNNFPINSFKLNLSVGYRF